MDDLERRLRSLPLRRPSECLDGLVQSQRPAPAGMGPRESWWRRRLSVPLPVVVVAAAAVVAIVLVRWPGRSATPPLPSLPVPTSPVVVPSTDACEGPDYQLAVYVPGAGTLYQESSTCRREQP
jgi:hypothetical protein